MASGAVLHRAGPIAGQGEPVSRQDFVKVSGVDVNVPSRRRQGCLTWSYRSGGPGIPGLPPGTKSPGAIEHVERVHGGPMTVVAGIVALLLLGYLVVALLKPERF